MSDIWTAILAACWGAHRVATTHTRHRQTETRLTDRPAISSPLLSCASTMEVNTGQKAAACMSAACMECAATASTIVCPLRVTNALPSAVPPIPAPVTLRFSRVARRPCARRVWPTSSIMSGIYRLSDSACFSSAPAFCSADLVIGSAFLAASSISFDAFFSAALVVFSAEDVASATI